MNYLLDTHVLVWRLLEPKRLSAKVKALFFNEENKFFVPTISFLEIQYLSEIGRVQLDIEQALVTIKGDLSFELLPYDELAMSYSLRLTSTRDPFDRIILAHALANSMKIITKDRWMKKTAPHLVLF